jgi:hypothetical protein
VNLTNRTTLKLREQGYLCENVEKYNYFTKRKNDLFGFIDVVAISKDETLAVQVTSKSNMSSRIKKISESDNYPLVMGAGWRIIVHGWFKNKKNRWECKEFEF